MQPPRYPADMLRAGAQGAIYLVIQIGRDGKVMNAVAEQINLTVVGSARDMERVRRSLGEAALDAARRWVFHPPTTGDLVDAPYWSLRVPVDFTMSGSRNEYETPYGTWHGYLPGPRQRVPWVTDQDALGSPDAVAGGELYPLYSRFRLLTPLPG
ncbi:energy transducer TonB [Luteimonas sp. RIT-PG2_3]